VAGVEEPGSVGAGDAVGGAVDGGEEVEAQAARFKTLRESPIQCLVCDVRRGRGKPDNGGVSYGGNAHDRYAAA
jgi:hypothetical protein